MKAKVIQAVEDAMVDAVMDSAAGLGLTPLQRAKFIVAISETLIDAVTPYVQHAGEAEAPAPRAPRKRGPRTPRKLAGVETPHAPTAPAPMPAVPPAPSAPATDTTQPAPFRGPPATAQPFSVS
jgi:hypothetical protein